MLIVALLAGCGDGPSGADVGETCIDDADCRLGLCSEQVCVDPLADDDQDGLHNALESALGTSPSRKDTDGDASAASCPAPARVWPLLGLVAWVVVATDGACRRRDETRGEGQPRETGC